MQQFQMHEQNVKVASVNPRAEKHGDENVLAADLKIHANCTSAILDQFDPKLRAFLFRKPAIGEQQSLPVDGNDGLTGIRCPLLGPIVWGEELPGYSLRITRGMGLHRPLEIDDVDLKKFVIEPIEGGSVSLTFSVACHPDTEQMGLLCDLIQEEIEITLAPPKAERMKKVA